VEFAQAVRGDVGEQTIGQSKLNDEPDQQNGVEVNPNEQTMSEEKIQQQQAELAIIEAKNLCHEKHIKAQQKTNELRESTLGYEDNYMTDFANSLVEGAESTAQSELEECLLKAQTQQSPLPSQP
jgi:hypothetical protein